MTVRKHDGAAVPGAQPVSESNLARYERIAPFYDVLDLPFERRRYRALRPLMFEHLHGRLLDAGVGTGRNCPFYPPDAVVSAIDNSPAMLARARRRCHAVAAAGRLYRMDVTSLAFPTGAFDAAVATFLFCVLPDRLQLPALQELGRVVRKGGSSDFSNTSGRRGPCTGSSPGYGSPGSPGRMARASTGTRKAMSRVPVLN